MITRYTTMNSVYEVDDEAKTVSKVEGKLADGAPEAYVAATVLRTPRGDVLYVAFAGSETSMVTSLIRETEVVEPDPCQYVTRRESLSCPPEFCDELAERGEGFCTYHLDGGDE